MILKELWRRSKPYLLSSDTILLLKRPAGTPIPEVADCLAEFRQITLDNVEDCLAFEDSSYVEVYKKKIADGDFGLYGYLNGKPVYRSWVRLSGEFSFKRAWKKIITNDSAYFEYSLTSPEARGNRIHRKAISIRLQKFFEKDAYTLVVPDNQASLKGVLYCGFMPYIKITVRYFCFIPFVKEEKVFEEYKHDI